jgi:predicted transcriptional regulator
MQQLTIRVPDEYLAGIEKIATVTGLKKSDITRLAIKKDFTIYTLPGRKKFNLELED